ncbi:MAG: DUF4932 domain-containing protein [Gemmatimonadaceae bacterium]
MDVGADTRLELLAIIFRLAGATEFSQDTVTPYARAVDAYFTRFRGHPVVAQALALRERRGISNDAVMSFAVHLSALPMLKLQAQSAGTQLDQRWTLSEATSFAELVQDFARASHPEVFFESQHELLDTASARMRAVVIPRLDVPWFQRMFGPALRPTRFKLTIGMLNGQWAYGVRVATASGEREAYAIMNPTARDSLGMPVFTEELMPIVIHEYGHSFVNPAVDGRLRSFLPAADTLRDAFSVEMKRQGYVEPRTIVSESVVRAMVARYRLDHEGPDSARKELIEQQANHFLWINDLFALIGSYTHSRDVYPTFDSFLPVIAGYFADLAPRARAVKDQFQRDLDSRRPRVVAIVPADGAQDVNPDLQTIAITFDRPMRKSFATMLIGADGKAHFPETLSTTWDSTRTVFRMSVRLRPNWTYVFGLNHERVSSFMSDEFVPLKPIVVRFTTGGG